MKYYVYMYLDPRKINTDYGFEPFYVGKGKDTRDMVHIATIDKDRSNLHKSNRIKAIIRDTGQNPIVKRVYTDLTEDKAFEIERHLIAKLGRVDLGTGCLLNLTDGGDGSRNMSAGGRKTLSERMRADKNPNYLGRLTKGRSRDDIAGANNYFYGTNISDERKKQLSEIRKQNWLDDREKYCKKYELISPVGDIHIVVDGLKQFCCEYGLSVSTIRYAIKHNTGVIAKGKCAGWSAKRIV